jgi:hypothetical protein
LAVQKADGSNFSYRGALMLEACFWSASPFPERLIPDRSLPEFLCELTGFLSRYKKIQLWHGV